LPTNPNPPTAIAAPSSTSNSAQQLDHGRRRAGLGLDPVAQLERHERVEAQARQGRVLVDLRRLG
jgi:hypothetical protein